MYTARGVESTLKGTVSKLSSTVTGIKGSIDTVMRSEHSSRRIMSYTQYSFVGTTRKNKHDGRLAAIMEYIGGTSNSFMSTYASKLNSAYRMYSTTNGSVVDMHSESVLNKELLL